MKSFQLEDYDETLVYKISELFWRVNETKRLSVENAIQIFQLLAENPSSMGGHENSICSRVLEGISDLDMI